MAFFSQLWLAHELTSSPLFLGAVGAANAVPALALGPFGGVLADRMDKRRIIVGAQIILVATALLLATLTSLEMVSPWHVLASAVVAGAVLAVDQPARQAFYPLLIDRDVMMSAVALNASTWQGARIAAPAAAGLIIAIGGTEWALYASAAGFAAMAAIVSSLKVSEATRSESRGTAREMMEGIGFIKDNPTFKFLIGMAFFGSFFGMGFIMLMPVFAVDILKVGADGQGFLLGISGVGSLLFTLWMGLRQVTPGGWLIIGGAAISGIAVAAFGLTSELVGSYALALTLMFVVGAFTSTYRISIMTSLQMMVPDHMRGRIMGLHGISWSIMPLGGLLMGAIATGPGVPWAVAMGGLAVTAFALGPALANRSVRNLGALLDQTETSTPASAASPRTTASPTGD